MSPRQGLKMRCTVAHTLHSPAPHQAAVAVDFVVAVAVAVAAVAVVAVPHTGPGS